MKAGAWALIAAVAWTFAASAAAAPAPEAARIARIEQDLRPIVQVRGRPLSAHSLTEEMAAHHLPSVSIAVVDGGRIAWARAYGLADVSAGTPATTRTLYQAGSVSKPVAASAAMQLVQEGRIALDRPVNAQLKSWRIPDNAFTADDPVTVRHLLTHTGGLTVHGFPGYAAGAPVPSVVQVLEGKAPANTPPVVVDQKPGSAWRYSGGGITVAQLLMTDVTGENFPALTQARVFGPLGMADSTYAQPLPAAQAEKAATGYLRDGAAVAGRFHTYPEMAAAGLWTTPTDLAKWAIALQRAYAGAPSRLMSRASAKAMLTPGLGGWGLGVQVSGSGDTLRFSHDGDDWGFKASLTGYMTGGRAIVVMANGDDAFAVIAPLVQAVAREYGWKGLAPRIVDPAPLSQAEHDAIVGRYGHGLLVISGPGQTLRGRAQGVDVDFIPQGHDRLLAIVEGQTGDVTVRHGADGKVTALSGFAPGLVLTRDP